MIFIGGIPPTLKTAAAIAFTDHREYVVRRSKSINPQILTEEITMKKFYGLAIAAILLAPAVMA